MQFGVSIFFITFKNKETTTLYFAPYTAGKDTESYANNLAYTSQRE